MSRITYRPNLEPERQYHTSGRIPSKTKEVEALIEKKPTVYEEVGEMIDNLTYYNMIIPDPLKPLAESISKAIMFTYLNVDPEKLKDENSGDGEVTLESKDPSSQHKDKTKDSVLSKFQPSFIIRVKDPVVVDQVNYHYNNRLLDIAKYHSNLYRNILADHYVAIKTLLDEHAGLQNSFTTKEYRLAPTKFKNPNNKHVSDFIIRSQVVKDQNVRLSQKLFNNTETLNLMKACDSSKELLNRYLKENFEPNVDAKSFFKSTTLDDSIVFYKERVEHNLYELYKYLNSSALALEKNLKMYIKETRAKAILLEEEEITL